MRSRCGMGADGALGYVFVERLSRRLNNELTYSRESAAGSEANLLQTVDQFFHFSNYDRARQALDDLTLPDLLAQRSK
jgi:hypothetical protein